MSLGNVFVAFQGPFTQLGIMTLGDMIRNRLHEPKTAKAVFAVFVELAQNIQRYSADRQGQKIESESVGIGMITVSEGERYVALCAANKIHKNDCDKLLRRLDRLAAMDHDQMAEAYKIQRKTAREPSLKGSGLGLFEISRRAASPVRVSIKKMDASHVSLKLEVKIRRRPSKII